MAARNHSTDVSVRTTFDDMQNRRVTQAASLLVALALMLASVVGIAQSVDAQEEPYPTCAAYGTIIGTGGQLAADAAAELQALSAPNPPGVDNVLEVIINGESDIPPIGSRPSADALAQAYVELDRYYAGVCADIDICPLIRQAVATNDGSSAEAARLARGITAPAPPGIDAALALISGAITVAESPFHASVAEAQAQIASYFPCSVAAPTEPPTPAGGDVVETCADLNVLGIPEGPRAVEAANSLRDRGAPNPPGIEAALDVLIDVADGVGNEPVLADVDAAYATLQGYFGGSCDTIDRCALVVQVVGSDAAAATSAAGLLWRLETPSPPGIGAALALIAGEIDESPFHNSVGQAQAQIADYYPCESTGAVIAFTGSSTGPLAITGAGMVITGTLLVAARRRLEQGDA